jgi:V/A-type H+-transporting ATPase subunit I
MIVKMKKITVLVQSKDVKAVLNVLGKKGVLHIEHERLPASEDTAGLEKRYRYLSSAIEVLPDPGPTGISSEDPEELVQEILNLLDEKEIILENLKKINRDIETWREWGDFEPALIDDLRDKGILVELCRITKNQMKDTPEGVVLEELFRKGSIFYCALISTRDIDLPFETLRLPNKGLQEMMKEERVGEKRIIQIKERLIEIAAHKDKLISFKKHLEALLEFDRTRAGMGRFEGLSYLTGYCPVYNVSLLERLAEQERWGLVIEEPGEDNNVPTLIKNPRWVEIIKPMFQMIKTVPGYREVDISFWFLLFFSIFFGMLVGDAGYGFLFFFVNLFCHVRFKNKIKDRSIFFLMYILSICAILWGISTGTFFGQSWLPQRVEPLLPFLRENRTVQALCFFIGAFHLSIAHLWRFIRKMPSVKAFSEAGWICVLWTAYFLARSLILGESFPEQARWLFVIGSSLIILCTNPTKNIFKTIGSGIGDFLLHIVNSFTDLVSYIRLFAVGAATVAVADAFNQMASGIGYGNILAGFLTAFVLLFGHTLNILLGAMAVLVHGVRLNILEFSSHLNMEWSGVEYAPFKGREK